MAPERLLVFEVTGSVQNFANAVSRIAGLEFAGEEELVPDEFDKNPEFYLLVPQLDALRQIASLWDGWQRTGTVPRSYTPWRDLFAQLRNVRPWGPADRVSEPNRDYFRNIVDGVPDNELVRVEIELVFRASEELSHAAEAAVTGQITRSGGAVIDRSRRPIRPPLPGRTRWLRSYRRVWERRSKPRIEPRSTKPDQKLALRIRSPQSSTRSRCKLTHCLPAD